MGKKGIPHRKWNKEDKLKYVRMHLEEHIAIRTIEQEHGINHSLISAWTKQYLAEGEQGLEPKTRPGNHFAALHKSKKLTEIERLRLIVAKQEVEIARLKKGYWVKGVGASKEYVTGSEKSTKSSKSSRESIQ